LLATERLGMSLLALTFEGFLFYAVIVGTIVGFIAYRVYLAIKRVKMWETGHAPGHESFIEVHMPRDVVFRIVLDVLPAHYTVNFVRDRERMVMGSKKVYLIPTDRVTVKVDPTLAGCEVIFARLGPMWWRLEKGAESPEARAFFNDLIQRLDAWARSQNYVPPPQTSQTTEPRASA
jgi:hypothetical protein